MLYRQSTARNILLAMLAWMPAWGVLAQVPAEQNAPLGMAQQQTKQPPAELPEPNKKVTTSLKWQGSLMFKEEDIHLLQEAVKSYEMNIPIEIVLPDLFSAPKIEPVIDASGQQDVQTNVGTETVVPEDLIGQDALLTIDKMYHLGSIVYLSDQNWILWVNGQRVTAEQTHPSLQVASVAPDAVVFILRASPVDVLYPNWNTAFPALDKTTSFVTNGKDVVLDSTTKDVAFVLRPNQSFVMTSMEVVEGKVSEASAVPSAPVPAEDAKVLDSIAGAEPTDTLKMQAIMKAMAKNEEQLVRLQHLLK